MFVGRSRQGQDQEGEKRNGEERMEMIETQVIHVWKCRSRAYLFVQPHLLDMDVVSLHV